jgi:exonuclease III
MRIGTFNINGINGRLPVLLRWLEERQPDVACLQELKAEQSRFPAAALEKAGYGALWTVSACGTVWLAATHVLRFFSPLMCSMKARSFGCTCARRG